MPCENEAFLDFHFPVASYAMNELIRSEVDAGPLGRPSTLFLRIGNNYDTRSLLALQFKSVAADFGSWSRTCISANHQSILPRRYIRSRHIQVQWLVRRRRCD